MTKLRKIDKHDQKESKWRGLLLSIPSLALFVIVCFVDWQYPLPIYWSTLFLFMGLMPLVILPSLDQIGYKTNKITVLALLSFSAVILAMLLIKSFIDVFPSLSYDFLASFMVAVLALHVVALYKEQDHLLAYYLGINAVFAVISYDFLNQQIIKLPF